MGVKGKPLCKLTIMFSCQPLTSLFIANNDQPGLEKYVGVIGGYFFP